MHFPVESSIEYVYYTESDQLVYFKDLDTLGAISKASNASCLILGRRAEKFYNIKSPSPAEAYREGYTNGRYCGKTGFKLSYLDGKVREDHVEISRV